MTYNHEQEPNVSPSEKEAVAADSKVKKDEILTELTRVMELYKDDKVLEAYRYLCSSKILLSITDPLMESVSRAVATDDDGSYSAAINQVLDFTNENVDMIRETVRKAKIALHLLKENEQHYSVTLSDDAKDTRAGADAGSNSESDGWTHTGVYHNPFPTEMSYKLISVQDDTSSTSQSILECKCVSVIPARLLQSLLAVLNETELYTTWVPSFSIPKFGIHSLTKTKQSGRVGQELNIVMDVPWPLKQRSFKHLNVWAFDDIDHQSTIGIKLQNISMDHGSDTARVKDDVVDMHVDGGFLIRPCPKDHPILLAAASKKSKPMSVTVDPEASIIVTFSASVDPKISVIPTAVFNFFTKVAFKQGWKMLLQIAMDVQNDKRLDHSLAIQKKKDLYDWIDSRLQVLLSSKQTTLIKHDVRLHPSDDHGPVVEALLQMMNLTSNISIS